MSDARVAMVTGASRGIGRAIAERLAADGFEIIGTATSDASLAQIEETLGPSGKLKLKFNLDVTDNDSIAALLDKLKDADLAPEILVNNAGITRDNLMLRMKDDEWADVIAANLNAVFSLSRGLLRSMVKARSGRMINITSVVGAAGNAGQANYAAAKAGVIGFTKSLAQEVANRNVTVNAVAPGFIDTDMTRKLNEQQQQAVLGQIPMARMGQASEIASAVAFLASEEAAYITGETLHVNGGMYMA